MTERIRLTKKLAKALEPPARGRRYVYDSEVKSLAICVTKTGHKSWYRMGRVAGRPSKLLIGPFDTTTLEQARREARRMDADIAEGAEPRARRRTPVKTVQEAFDWVLEHHCKPRKKTWERDLREYESKVKPIWGSRRLDGLTSAEIVEHHNHLVQTLGPFAANKMREVLRLIFSIAVRHGWVEKSPLGAVPRAKVKSRERFLSADELKRWFKAVANLKRESSRDFLLMCLFTGARRGNVCSMRWDEIDFDQATWTIPGEKFKNGEPQTIVLVEQPIDILRRRQTNVTSEWVFPGPGKTGHLTEPKAAWKKVCEEAGLVDVRLHDLRRTLGSWQAAAGASLQVIGKSLGHRSQSATAIYARLDLEPVRASVAAAVNAIDATREDSKKSSK